MAAEVECLVDGHMLAYRCLHGMPDLRSSVGVPTGLEYGFLRCVESVQRRYGVTRVVVCWDAPNSSDSRRELYPGYKARRREKRRADADTALPRIAALRRQVLENLWAWAEEPGREADDLMFTLARRSAAGLCLVYTNDQDLLQAVDERTIVLKSRESKTWEWDVERVDDKFNVRPGQLALLRAVLGDPSDELPGCKAFGAEKTAEYVREAYRLWEPGHGEPADALIAVAERDVSREGYYSEKRVAAWRAFVGSGQLHVNYRVMVLEDVHVAVHEPRDGRDAVKAFLQRTEIRSLRLCRDYLDVAEDEEF